MLAIVGASGKIGFATLTALLKNNLVSKTEVVVTTSSTPGSTTWQKLSDAGIEVRHADFENPQSMKDAFRGTDSIYLVSTPRVELDYNDAPHGSGRERHHFVAIDAARAAGVKHIYYTSLAFGRPSVAGVMRAHIRTEEYLESLDDGTTWTVLREGLYNESWPLYLGYFDVPRDSRQRIVVAGDGLLNWTAIDDLGLASALVIAGPKRDYAGKTLHLSTQKNVKTLSDVAKIVGDVRGQELRLDVVSAAEHRQHHVGERGQDSAAVEWWMSSYAAVKAGETHITDELLDTLLASRGVEPKSMEDTIKEMLR